MSTVALVSCVKAKRSVSSPARDLYTSALFRAMRRYAEAQADAWFILSAEHGLVHPEQVLDPYERTLNKMTTAERRVWAQRVQQSLLTELPAPSNVVILAGLRYREFVVPFLREHGFLVTIPLAGLRLGHQLQRLKALTRNHVETL
jgi:hypothetical protein